MQAQIAEAIAQLAAATHGDHAMVANLAETNGQRTYQGDNLDMRLTYKDREIKALQDSINSLIDMVEKLAMAQTTATDKDTKKKKKKPKQRFCAYYCWSYGVTNGENHTSRNCGGRKDGHRKKVTLFNGMGGSTIGIED
eukprot:667562-Ditylum_brightwellii.AAC.1